MLDAEVRKLRSGSDWSNLLEVAALHPTYGFGNLMLINLQMPDATWVARADAWARLGRQVKTGQAIKILTPIRSRTTSPAAVESAGEAGPAADVEQEVIGFRVGSVYDVSATSGPPISYPYLVANTGYAVARTLWEGLAREAAADGFAVDVRPLGDGSAGFTDFDSRRIVVADHLNDFRAIERLAHEVGHVRMHSPDQGDGKACTGLREVEADSVAYAVLARYGISSETRSFSYLAGWAKAADPDQPANVIKATGVRVTNTSRRLIESADEYLKVHGVMLGPVTLRPQDQLSPSPELDGPVP
ncbi:ImmA/IrrE family metallo-endopeptidase [Kribbella shirazensis]|uniref:IrrE N-terminal-like domain-containing protein n=1 Tax=Kribbella shirazensis TaxID=1105143 RepID=A0A7X6A4V9_9ACTN|nr:ImmA/IrrE family metallo-endopeptidase [Kribbella shirazensis]NIK61308.1 hypothetical protein [Kribbella shirazensis]